MATKKEELLEFLKKSGMEYVNINISKLAPALNVSPQTARKHIKTLIQEGYITGIDINLKKLGYDEHVFLYLDHPTQIPGPGTETKYLLKELEKFPEIVEVYSITGGLSRVKRDHIMAKCDVRNKAHFEDLFERLRDREIIRKCLISKNSAEKV